MVSPLKFQARYVLHRLLKLILFSQIDGKFDQNLAQEAFDWIVEVTGKPVQPAPEDGSKVHEALGDGVILCEYGS